MNNIQLINYIATHPEYTNIVIADNDDKTPIQAIEYLSCEYANDFELNRSWRINGTLEKNTLLVY